MANPFYNASGVPSTSSFGYSAAVRGEFANIAAGFALLPAALTANKAVIINSGGTGMTVSAGNLTLTKDLTVSNSVTFTGTDGSTVNFGTGGTILYSGAGIVSSITGTANEIAASAATGAVILSLPAALTFTGKTITGGSYVNPAVTTQAVTDNSTKAASTAFVYALMAPSHQNFLTGFNQSTAGASATFTVGVGQAADSTNVDMLTLTTALAKTTSAWSVGNAGSLDTGAIANSTWYYPFVIKRTDTGVVDILTSLANGRTATVTMTIASPGIITWADHGLQANAPIKFTTTGALPTGLVAGTQYFVKTVVDVNTFSVSATQGGVAINTSGSQSGVHTITSYPVMPANYTEFRGPLMPMKTNGSAQWTKFLQYYDQVIWDVQVTDASGTLSAVGALITLSVPPGLNVMANLVVQLDFGASNEAIYITCPDQTNTAAGAATETFQVAGSTAVRQVIPFNMMTNTSGQIRQRSENGSSAYQFKTAGFVYARGK